MKKVRIILGGFLVAVMIFIGCGKDGDPGPQGEVGPQGEKGEQGEAGSVDIIYSDWLELDWNVSDSPTFLAHALEISELTHEFIEEGGILLLFVRSGDFVYPIPFSGGNDYAYYEIHLPGDLFVYVGHSGSSSVEAFLKDGEYRYILIPGGVSKGGRVALPEDYSALAAHYNLSN